MPSLPALPDPVRGRVVSLAARALGQMSPAHIPAVLRKSASFAPAKRARLIGPQLAAVLDADEAFRDHLGVQVRVLSADVAAALESGSPDLGHLDRVEVAAVAYIVRPPGWAEVFEQAIATVGVAQGSDQPAAIGRNDVEVAVALDRARADLQVSRDKARTRIDALKAENAQLRQTLGRTRLQAKEAAARSADVRSQLDELAQTAAAAARAHEAEVRRLQARLTSSESAHSAARRAARDDRESEVMRLRLLLDTVTDAASGLRRELALPPSDLLPADTVVALEPAEHLPARDAGRALGDDDPALLRQLLSLPQVHLIVDGYNVSKAAWPALPLDQQRTRLSSGLSALLSGRRVEVTVVFDGADLVHPPPVSSPRGVRVRFSPPDVIADDLIRQLVEAEPSGRPLVVVSSDKEVARSVVKKGARAVAAEALVKALAGA